MNYIAINKRGKSIIVKRIMADLIMSEKEARVKMPCIVEQVR